MPDPEQVDLSLPSIALASPARPPLSVTSVNSSFVGGGIAALHVIDKGAQLGQRLVPAGIVEKHAWRHRRIALQHAHQLSCCERCCGDRLGHLGETNTFYGGAEHGGKIVRYEGSHHRNVNRPAAAGEGPTGKP